MSTIFVAEVGSNHNADLDRCFRFIETARAIGCAAVKFQLFKLDQLFSPEIIATSPLHQARRAWELPERFIEPIARRCLDVGVQFSCTPFYLEAVEILRPYVDFFKIASYDILRLDLVRACAKTGKPLVMSTGMATLEEIDRAVEGSRAAPKLTLLHCVSAYPTPLGDCNLSAIGTLRRRYGVAVGLSDHSVNAGVILRSVLRWQADLIEFHFDLDDTGNEYTSKHCWKPDQIAGVIRALGDGEIADGTGVKEPEPSELPDREWRADPSDGLRPLKSMREKWVMEHKG